MTEYLIKDFGTLSAKNNPPIIRIVRDNDDTEDGLWGELDAAKKDGNLIAVYAIGPCVLDWS